MKRLLPSLVKDSVESMVKLALTNEFENALHPAVCRIIEENYATSLDTSTTPTAKVSYYEKRLKALENQVANAHEKMKTIDVYDKIRYLES